MHLFLLIKQILQIPVSPRLHVCIGDKSQRRAVDAVAHTVGRFRVILKYMAQMSITCPAAYFGTDHAVAGIEDFHNGRFLNGF